MRFHLPSYLLGIATGVTGAAIADRLRPIAMELATAGYRIADALMLRTARARENFSDMLAEARARARGTLGRAHLHIVPEGE